MGPTPSAARTAAACLAAMVAGAAWPFVVAVLASTLTDELGFSAAGLGIAYAAYYLVASTASRPAGSFIDRRPLRVSAWLLATLCSVGFVILATARSWLQLVASGLVGGVGLALANPLTNAAIAASMTGSRARWAVGIKQAGVPLAAALSGAVIPGLAAAIGWRGGVAAATTLPLAAVAGSWYLAGRPARPDPRTRAATPRRAGLEGYALLLGIVAAGLNGYLALFVVDALDGSIQQAGAVMTVFAVTGAAGRMLWAAFAGGDRTFGYLRALAVIGAAGLVALAIPSAAVVVWIAAVTCGATVMAWQGVAMLAVLEAGGSAIGEASGRVVRMFDGGFVVGSPAIGAAIDQMGFRLTWGALAVVTLTAATTVRPR